MEDDVVTHLGRVHVCGNCGEINEGPKPASGKFYDLEDFYPDGNEGYIPVSATGDELLAYFKEKVTEITLVKVSCCGAVDDEDLYEFDDAWKCNDCEEVHENKDDAVQCCVGTRQWQQEREEMLRTRHMSEVEKAKDLLQREGYQVFGGQPTTNTTTSAGLIFPSSA